MTSRTPRGLAAGMNGKLEIRKSGFDLQIGMNPYQGSHSGRAALLQDQYAVLSCALSYTPIIKMINAQPGINPLTTFIILSKNIINKRDILY